MHLLYCLFLISVFMYDFCDCKTYNVFLNSHKDCGSNELYDVSIKKDYIIKPDVSPNTQSHTFRDCEVTFHSVKEDGHICLLQTGNVGIMLDPNAQLEASDGLGDSDDEKIQVLTPNYRRWALREYCSKSPYITLYLKRIRKEMRASIRKVKIEFKVVDIESTERSLYLDGTYCNSQNYELLDSTVSIWNRPQFPGMTVTKLTSECVFRFDRIKGHRNTSICFSYVPSENVNCDSSWRFAVSIADFSLDEKDIKYSLRCNDSKAQQIHVWCAEPSVNFVIVIFWRGGNILSNSTIEPSKMFQYFIMDYKGTEESLLQEIKGKFATSSSGLASKWMIYTISAVAFVLVVIIIVICCKRRERYKSVDHEETSKAV